MNMSNDREWLGKRAEREDKHFVSVGGLESTLEEEHPNAELRPETAAELVSKYLKVLSERQKP